jgi:hypothetical protein
VIDCFYFTCQGSLFYLGLSGFQCMFVQNLIFAQKNCCIVHAEELHLNLQFHWVLSTNHNRPIQKNEWLAKHYSILVKLCLIKPPQGKNNSRASTEQQLLINKTSVMVRSKIKDSTKSKTCQKWKVGHSVLNNYTMKQRL